MCQLARHDEKQGETTSHALVKAKDEHSTHCIVIWQATGWLFPQVKYIKMEQGLAGNHDVSPTFQSITKQN